jgi:lactobin A/cerein 7B family class IIb bacteriocin
MAITKERAEALSAVLTADVDRTKAWLVLTPEEAVEKINALGHDFTVEEINEYGEAMKLAATQDELNADQLEGVSGGVAPWLIVAGAMGVAALCGVGVGGLEKAKIW